MATECTLINNSQKCVLPWGEDECRGWESNYEINMDTICDLKALKATSMSFRSTLLGNGTDETCFIGQTEDKKLKVRMIPRSTTCGCAGRCGYCRRGSCCKFCNFNCSYYPVILMIAVVIFCGAIWLEEEFYYMGLDHFNDVDFEMLPMLYDLLSVDV